ncbi:thiol-disulfide oxidoreductase DCC family protein [Chelatococcus reniformis]|uniref:Thiol-disulfide oxidoreductase n=1 Tax=Chelatococcus reniformis TaxID=1494448 RepID=A0A916X7I2_9HYPH|nr:thiol-disulfide oxidoreductase DCC family protein [Chelatococcus reniformis]GGC45099.1 thiol-disulfide oxidoreductase [Chelatococcus reniformis]
MPEPYSYRRDPAVPPFADDQPIIVFDGHCVLCSGFARFILDHDHKRRYRLLAAQSPLGEALYRHFGLAAGDYETNLLLEDGRVRIKADGSIRILEGLGLPWSLAALGRLLPRPLADRLYGVIARNRLRWFGRRETCFMPDPAQADRFVEPQSGGWTPRPGCAPAAETVHGS